MQKPRHFKSLLDISTSELLGLIQRAQALKTMKKEGIRYEPLKNRVLGIIFEKSSTRTRVSLETAMYQFGGNTIFLSPRDTQIGRGEPIEDTARVLSSMVDCVALRTFSHTTLERFAAYSSVPVVNALTDAYHPCQLLADIQTYIEYRGSIQGRRVAWVGDGYNMCNSYINAARQFDFHLNIAVPPGYEPSTELIEANRDRVTLTHSPQEAMTGVDLVCTDVWASMGQEEEQASRLKAFKPFQVDEALMSVAAPDALFMHCLPAHRGEEVAAKVLDGPQSVVWTQAENRLYAQKALLEFLLADN